MESRSPRTVRPFAIGTVVLALVTAGLALPVHAAAPASQPLTQPRVAVSGTNGTWSSVASGLPNSTVMAMARGNDDTIYFGGNIGGAFNNLAAWSPGQQSFSTLGQGVSTGMVLALAVAPDDTVYIGGAFSPSPSYIATWSPATGAITQLGGGSGDAVRALAIKDDTLYLGGDFTNKIAEWGPLSSASPGYAPLGSGLNATVTTIDGASDDSLFIGGDFTGRITQWGPLSTSPAFASVGSGLDLGSPMAIATSRDDTVFIAGTFTTTGAPALTLNRVAAWSPTAGYQPLGFGLSGDALSVAVDDTNALVYAGGFFDYACGSDQCLASDDTVPLEGVGAFDLRTRKWVPLSVNGASGVNVYVRALIADDTDLYLGGFITQSTSGTPLNAIAKWTWAPPSGNSVVQHAGFAPVVVPGQSFVGVTSVTIGGSPAIINYAQSSSTQLKVTPPGLGLGNHDIEVTAVGGTAIVGTYRIARPSAPVVSSSSSGPTSVDLTWTLDDTGGSAVIYQVALDDTTSIRTSTSSTSVTLSGLNPSTTYNAFVRAINDNGPGQWSAPATVTTQAQSQSPTPAPPAPAPASPPGAPTSVSAIPGNASAVVSWTPPTDSGTYPITSYVVRSQPGGLTCSTTSTACTVTGLTNGTAYTFTVTASSAAGAGPASAASASVTPRTVPGAPVSVAATPGIDQASISWSPPSDDGGSAITGYRVTTVPASSGCQTLATTCTLTDLDAGQEYLVTVVAVNAAGESAPSQPVTVTPRERPVILITGARGGKADALVRVKGEIRGLEVRTVQPYYRLAKQRAFRSAASPVPVTDGSFTWQRATSKKMTVYVEAGDLRSNTVSVPAR